MKGLIPPEQQRSDKGGALGEFGEGWDDKGFFLVEKELQNGQ